MFTASSRDLMEQGLVRSQQTLQGSQQTPPGSQQRMFQPPQATGVMTQQQPQQVRPGSPPRVPRVSQGMLCNAEEQIKENFQWVGEGRGTYNQVSAYEYAGEGAGAFMKTEKVVYAKWRPRPLLCFAIVLFIFIASLIGFVVTTLLAAVGSQHNTKPMPVVMSTTTPDLGPAEGDITYCFFGDMSTWHINKVDFCCKNKGMGCPADGFVQPLFGIGKLTSPLQGCNSVCEFEGKAATCAQRIQDFAANRFKFDPRKCDSAYQATIGPCSFCTQCELSDANCVQ